MASRLKHFRINPIFCRNFHSSEPNAVKNHYDIIVAGGGMVGSAITCALKKDPKLGNKKILMLEGSAKRAFQEKPKRYSNRVVSLNAGTRKFFERIGVWQHIEAGRYSTVKKLQVWDSNSDAVITFNHENYSDVSYIVENDLILSALQKELTNCETEIVYDTKIENVQLPKEDETAGSLNSAYSFDLLIGAEGFNSATRAAMQTQWLAWNYKQFGVVATLKLAEPTNNIVAWQRFLPTGPIALLPLTDQLSSLVWTTTPQLAKELVQMPTDAFVTAVNDAFWKTETPDPVVSNVFRNLDRILENLSLASASSTYQQLPPSVIDVSENSRASFPLGFGHAARYVAPGAALIGDAAHRVHPLAGQGVNLGFGDAECLAALIADAVYSGKKLSSLDYLHEYERKRQCHNFPTMLAIDALQKLYNSSITPVVLLRSVGMQIANSLLPVKRAIMNHASH